MEELDIMLEYRDPKIPIPSIGMKDIDPKVNMFSAISFLMCGHSSLLKELLLDLYRHVSDLPDGNPERKCLKILSFNKTDLCHFHNEVISFPVWIGHGGVIP